jgi:hypothetical protein
MLHKFLTDEKLAEYDLQIDNDPYIPREYKENFIIREVCRAGLYLCDALDELGCPHNVITRIQFTAGRLSFGRDPWEVHKYIIDEYRNNRLVLADEARTVTELN